MSTEQTATDQVAEKSPPQDDTSKTEGGSSKKKAPPFWEREIKIDNPKAVDTRKLLETLHERFTTQFMRWKRQAKIFKCANFLVTMIIVAVQVLQVVIFQIPGIPSGTKNGIATILPAITGAALAVQLKLGWGEKSIKCKKCARLFHKMANHTRYRLDMVESGGQLSDSTKLWSQALISESAAVPPFMVAY